MGVDRLKVLLSLAKIKLLLILFLNKIDSIFIKVLLSNILIMNYDFAFEENMEEFVNWLETEIGFTKEELVELAEDDRVLLPEYISDYILDIENSIQ